MIILTSNLGFESKSMTTEQDIGWFDVSVNVVHGVKEL